MSSIPYHDLLERAGELWGIEPEYWDIWGQRHVTSDETRRTILRSMGVAADDAAQLAAAIDRKLRGEWARLLAPSLVISGDQRPQQIYINVPRAQSDAVAHFEIQREDGTIQGFEACLRDSAVAGSMDLGGETYVRKQVALPEELPLGYHDVRVALGALAGSMRLIVTPDRAYSPPVLRDGGRAAGIAIPLYAVRSARNWGCGDFRDLAGVIDWVADELRASFVALNPLHAIHNRRPFNISPYLPNSVFYQNFLYLDIEGIQGFAGDRRVQRLWRDPATQAELTALRATDYVDYEKVSAWKLRFLKLLFVAFLREFRADAPRARSFREFMTREGELLERFATYCSLDNAMHRRNPDAWCWPDWPEPYRDPESPETSAFRKQHWRSVLFQQYVQWQIDLQLGAAQEHARRRGLSIGLYHDLALATDRFGSDLWAHRPFYVAGCRVGSPPDDFSPKGQDWGFPPPNSDHHRETGYALFRESIRKNCRHGGALRIDHVMRFFRLYWIPDAADATGGAYVRDRHEDLVRILALESVRQNVVVVGEDLGTVQPAVRQALARFGILSYRLFYFEKEPDGAFRPHRAYPQQALVSSTTHDLPTLAGFWVNADIEARRGAGLFHSDSDYHAQLADRLREKQKMLDMLFALGLLPGHFPRSAAEVPELAGELHNAIIGFLALTPSQLLAINQEDLTKETEQQNLPATTWQYPNWSRKMRFTLEDLRAHPQARDFTAMVRNWLERTGRTNP